jgi:serine/threonine protein kinase
MLQVARGMEYLHSRNIYHGDLNPSNVLVVKTRQADAQRLHVKVAGFAGQQSSSTAVASPRVSPKAAAAANQAVNPCIWYAPEVLEQEEPAKKRTEKADVYSFAMICFELLTGKIPFEDNHLQGENTSKNIRAGERPLFPFQTPKYLTGLVRRCWHADPAQRPAFASVCRVLRYVKRFLVLNQNQPDSAAPPFDYLDIEAILLRRFPEWQGSSAPRVADVPFQMYAYRVMEKEKARAVLDREKQATDSSSDGNSVCGDDGAMLLPDTSDSQITGTSKARSPRKLDVVKNTSRLAGKLSSVHRHQLVFVHHHAMRSTRIAAGPPQKSRSMGVVRPPQIATRRTPRIKSDGQLNSPLPSSRRRVSAGGHLSDSELA